MKNLVKRHARRATVTVIAAVAGIAALVTGTVYQAPPAQAAWGHRAYHCHVVYARTSFKTQGVLVTGYQRACIARNKYGTHFMPATSSPHFAFTSTNQIGNILSFSKQWGPTVTYRRTQVSSPWQFPYILNPNYSAWLLTHKHYRHTVEVRQTQDEQVHLITIAGVSVKTEILMRSRWIVGRGLQVCDLTDHKCSKWRHGS